jgi:large conductance mechanosensitive channel
MGMLREFKLFAIKGNVLDLAIGIVIGAAFGSIVTAVVDNILMPIVGMLTGGVDFKSLAVKVGSAELKYGMFIQASVTFLIISFFLFLVVQFINKLKREDPPKAAGPLPPTPTEKLLMEIRDALLANQNQGKTGDQ